MGSSECIPDRGEKGTQKGVSGKVEQERIKREAVRELPWIKAQEN